MTKRYHRGISAVFCLFLGGILLWSLILPDRAKSETENRTLQQRPQFSWGAVLDGSYMENVEAYLSDQFPLRDSWTGLKARCEQLLGKTEFHGVYLCGDTLISKVDAPTQSLAEKNLACVQSLAGKTDARVYLGLIPSAAEIWKDQLPAGAESWDQSAFLQQAAQTGLPMIDFQTALAAHAEEAIFYRTDHHWTTCGAFYGYEAVLKAMNLETEPVYGGTPETVSKEFNGTLYSTSGIHWLEPDSMEFWVPDTNLAVTSWRTGSPENATLYDRAYLDTKDKYSAFLGGNQPLCVIRNESLPAAGKENKILLVRDSYSDSLAPFLAQNFEEVHLLDLRYYHGSVAQYAAEQGIEDILVLYSIPNFVTDQNLAFLTQ